MRPHPLRDKARELRGQGLSYKEIREITRISNSSLSYMLKGIELSSEQQERLLEKQQENARRTTERLGIERHGKEEWERRKKAPRRKKARGRPHKFAHLTEDDIRGAIKKTTTMKAAAGELGMAQTTFRKYARRYGLYAPSHSNPTYDMENILAGKHPEYTNTSRLPQRLVKLGLKEYRCEKCGVSDHCGEPLTLELDHINGDNRDHQLDNLRLLCPNCHSQTPTYRNKNTAYQKRRKQRDG